ncbi:Papilin [Micractinium conductrix]|uniref:Papilin n=1 Tax=Micractinium conductrix TaxID=554055 RepID=A0A2P6VPT2_9CHLO|nr:Papilin [Micractinium conductrix]|eukprot:PSC76067.1 Papilin [Micractinium conductrix]
MRVTALAVLLLALCSSARANKEPWRRCLEEPAEVGPCRGRVERWTFDPTSATCVKFYWGGCQGSRNRFNTKRACEQKCRLKVPRCALPAAPGSGDVQCMAYMPRWAWDEEKKDCVQFVYGGCGGNRNNFETKELCLKRCSPKSAANPCNQPKAVGPCRGRIERWFYNKQSAQCEQFMWGGCKGNKNNFKDQMSCEYACVPEYQN